MTFDCGVTREMGEDPVAVCRYLGERDVINHVHFRNVRVRKPYIDYTEVFLDEGQVNMFAVMKELVRQKYPSGLYPEHPRALDIDRQRGIRNQYPGGGGLAGEIYNVSSGHGTTLGAALDMLLETSGVEARVVVDEARLRPTDAPRLVGSNRKLRLATGWAPEIPLRTSLEALYAHFHDAR